MIRVVMAEDLPLLRESIKFMIENDSDIKVVGTAGDGLSALDLCKALKPDVVLMDIMMPICDGVHGTKLIKEFDKSIKVIILTTFMDDENIGRALRNGADSYVLKDMDPYELVNIIKSVKKGFSIIQEDVLAALSHNLPKSYENKDSGNNYNLTERDISIIKLLVDGKSYKEIAGELFITEGSVRNAASNILRKLGLKDKVQLAVFAVKNKLV